MTEHRTFRNVEVREGGEGPNGRPVVSLRAIAPGVVDDYGSLWNPATFDQRMTTRVAADPHDTPTLCWAHDWSDPIGHGIGFSSDASGPFIDFELDDPDAVPRAKQAAAQLKSRTIRDCSVGFSNTKRRPPTEDETREHPGIKEVIEEADLDEVSLVLRGAVPGAKVLSLRSADGRSMVVPEDLVVDLGKKVAAGELTHVQAAAALALAAGSPTPAPEPVTESLSTPDAALIAGSDAVLEAFGIS